MIAVIGWSVVCRREFERSRRVDTHGMEDWSHKTRLCEGELSENPDLAYQI